MKKKKSKKRNKYVIVLSKCECDIIHAALSKYYRDAVLPNVVHSSSISVSRERDYKVIKLMVLFDHIRR